MIKFLFLCYDKQKAQSFLIILFVSSFAYSQHRSYTDKFEYRKKRHEINIGLGASNCLTDLGGNYSCKSFI